MSDGDDALERRLAAVERAIDGEATRDRPGSVTDHEDLESRIAALETRVDELDAAVQAVRGFLGGVSAVNESVERRADAAVAAVDRLERRLDEDASIGTDGGEISPDDAASNSGSAPTDGTDERPLRERLRDLP